MTFRSPKDRAWKPGIGVLSPARGHGISSILMVPLPGMPSNVAVDDEEADELAASNVAQASLSACLWSAASGPIIVAVVLRESPAEEDDGNGGGGLEGGADCFEESSPKDEKDGDVKAAVGSGVNRVTRSRT